MVKRLVHFLLMGILATLASGCFVVSGSVAVTVVAPGSGRPAPAPTLPLIQLEYAGNFSVAEETFYQWTAGGGNSAGGSGVASGGSLIIPHGSSLNIIVSYPAAPAALWVAELDGQGVPLTTTVLSPLATVMPYTPTVSGQYQLQVMAEWTAQQYVLSLFEIDVR